MIKFASKGRVGGGRRGRTGLLRLAGCAGEVVGGNFGELLFDEDEGAEVEALDFGCDSMWLRVMAPQRVVTKVCGSTVWLVVGSAWPLVMRWVGRAYGVAGEGKDFGFEVEADASRVCGSGGGVGVGFAGALL